VITVSEAAAPSGAALVGGVALLERALGYTLGSLVLVTPAALASPTPCRGWDLRALLAHMNDSLLALHEAMAAGFVGLEPEEDFGDPSADPVATLRNRACHMMGAWAGLRSAAGG
jgi:mycothiol maleylpyruvate isomerase-like protein